MVLAETAIVNAKETSGFDHAICAPMAVPYVASKHAIEGLSESLRREMMLFGIDVIIVAPGPVKTPIWSKAEQQDMSGYKNSPFFPALEKTRKFMLTLGETGLPAETIAEVIADALTSARPKVRYQIAPDPIQQLIGSLLPNHAETVVSGSNTFALAFAGKSVTATRSELGLRTDKSFAVQDGIFTLRGRFAWAHDFNTDRAASATFQTLPGATFVVTAQRRRMTRR